MYKVVIFLFTIQWKPTSKLTYQNDVQETMKECSVNQHSYNKVWKAAFKVLINVTIILKTSQPLVAFRAVLKLLLSKDSLQIDLSEGKVLKILFHNLLI